MAKTRLVFAAKTRPIFTTRTRPIFAAVTRITQRPGKLAMALQVLFPRAEAFDRCSFADRGTADVGRFISSKRGGHFKLCVR